MQELDSQDEPLNEQGFTVKQQRFIEEFCAVGNATQAAIRAGYDPANARQMGYENLTKPYIRKAVDERLAQMAMPGEVALKQMGDIARTRLNDFMYTTPVQGYEQEEQYVTILINHARNAIKGVEAFIGRNKLTKETRKPFDAKIARLYEQIADWEEMVERWGDDVTLIVPGRPVVHYVTRLDLPALARAKEEGRIKKFKETKDGVEVEMHAADGALRDILKIAGLYEKHNKQKKDTLLLTIGGKPFPGQVAPTGDE